MFKKTPENLNLTQFFELTNYERERVRESKGKEKIRESEKR